MNTIQPISEVERLRDCAHRQIQARQLDAAQISLQLLVQRSPQDLPAWLELSNVLVWRGQWKNSIEPLLQATRHLPRHAPLILRLVQELIARGEIIAARQCLDLLAQAVNPPAELLRSLAGLRFILGEVASANKLLECALEAGVDDADSHYMHGLLLKFVGDLDGASRELERCLERWPQHGDAVVQLVNLRTQKADANQMACVEKQLGQFSENEQDRNMIFVRAQFEYARFKILDDLNRHQEAWPALMRCNQRMHKLHPYRMEAESAVTDALIRMPIFNTVVKHVLPAPDAPMPIFIVGMPRSGTTLLEHMLSAHSQIGSAGEIIDFQRQLRVMTNVIPGQANGFIKAIERSQHIDFRELGMRYLQQTRWHANGCAYYIDKLPSNIQMIAFIRRALPYAPVLHIVREPLDVCFSNFKAMFGSGSPYSYDLDALAHYYRQYAKLVTHWHRQLPGAMLDVSYAELVGNTKVVMHQVLTYCGLSVEEACLYPERNTSPVATPSSAQVREPVHQRSIGQWRCYAAQLQPLKDALADLVDVT